MQDCSSTCLQQGWRGWRGDTDCLQGLLGTRLPHKLLGGRGEHLVDQRGDCKDGDPPCIWRALCWSKTTARPWTVPPYVQGDGSDS